MNDLHQLQLTTECHYYNETSCKSGGHKCNGTDQCKPVNESPDKPTACYVLWHKREDGEFAIKLKGCWVGNADCQEQDRCVERRKDPKRNLFFCCCSGNNCNEEMHHDPVEESNHMEADGKLVNFEYSQIG